MDRKGKCRKTRKINERLKEPVTSIFKTDQQMMRIRFFFVYIEERHLLIHYKKQRVSRGALLPGAFLTIMKVVQIQRLE